MINAKINKLLQLMRDNAADKPRPLNIVRNEDEGEATLYLYDVIDPWWGISAESMAREVATLSNFDTLHLRVNSPGGDVFEGRAIRTAMREFKGKTIGHIDGLAASAATTVVDGCDEIEISEGAFYMIHNGWTLGYGNRHEFSKTVKLLEKVDAAIANDYAKRTGVELAQLVAWMDDETWFSSDEAVQHGFATRLAVVPDKSESASNRATAGPRDGVTWVLDAFDKVPKNLLQAPAKNDTDWGAIRAANERRLRILQVA